MYYDRQCDFFNKDLRITDTRIFQNIFLQTTNIRFNQLIYIHSIISFGVTISKKDPTQLIDPNKTPTTERDNQDITKTNGTTTSMQDS